LGPPADPSNALQVQVSYLRRTLPLPGGDALPALRTVGGGYLLDVEPDHVDIHRFERGVSSATSSLSAPTRQDAEAALGQLRAALALWRGEPLLDVAFEKFAAAEVARLDELRMVAVEREIDALLLLGRHDEVAPMLQRLVAEQPLRERMRAQLVLALYRLGRQAEALRAFDNSRRYLVDELGVEPGAELQRVHRAVLGQDETSTGSPCPTVRQAMSTGQRGSERAPCPRGSTRSWGAAARSPRFGLRSPTNVSSRSPGRAAPPRPVLPSLSPRSKQGPGPYGWSSSHMPWTHPSSMTRSPPPLAW